LTKGTTVGQGWVVIQELDPAAHATGGNFSKGFLVERNGQRAFMKVFDVMAAAGGGPDPMRQIQAATSAFNFERDLLGKCKVNNLSHVVVPIEDGVIPRTGILPLHYIVFEAADGDVRRIVRAKSALDASWLLRCMHGICVGINQLHSIDIAHQDLKPSNVLVAGTQAKIADLGRASSKGGHAAHDAYQCAGDVHYAPPELLYGYVSNDWAVRRLACDYYLVGSMMTYMINAANMTLLMLSNIASPYRPGAYKGLYRDVAVHLRHALEDSLLILSGWLDGDDGREIIGMIRSMCDPEPETRLDLVRGGRTNPPLEFYISRLDFLSNKAGAGVLRLAKQTA
jgi:serine/threonine protein kinase